MDRFNSYWSNDFLSSPKLLFGIPLIADF